MEGQGIGVRVLVGARYLSFPRRPDSLWNPPGLLSYGALFPGLKRPDRKTDHSSPTSAESNKTYIYTSTPINFNGVMLNELSAGQSLLLPSFH
jgi:hypothetical protein